MRRPTTLISLAAITTLALAGCTSTPQDTDETYRVVASTSVYAQIVSEIGGDHVAVSSIVHGAAQDPHAYEATVQDRLEVDHADLVVVNGGGYDAFMTALVGDSDTPVITATDFDPAFHEHADDADAEDHGDHVHIEGANEHVWYDFDVVRDVANAITAELTLAMPDATADFQANETAFLEGLDQLQQQVDELATTYDHAHIFVTEPVPLALTDAIGMHNVAPEDFLEAVEEGQDVAPAVLLESIDVLTSESVQVVIANTQTGGPETDRIISSAQELGIPVISFSELIPEAVTYTAWMQQNLTDLATALAA